MLSARQHVRGRRHVSRTRHAPSEWVRSAVGFSQVGGRCRLGRDTSVWFGLVLPFPSSCLPSCILLRPGEPQTRCMPFGTPAVCDSAHRLSQDSIYRVLNQAVALGLGSRARRAGAGVRPARSCGFDSASDAGFIVMITFGRLATSGLQRL